MLRTDNIGEIAAALSKANLEIRNAELDRVNPHFKNRYATLGSIINAIRVPLAKNGIAPVQTVSMENGMVTVTTALIHSSGQLVEDTAMFPLPDKATVQQMGSAITYLRRYALAAIVGIVGDEDDDGEGDRRERTERRPEPRRETFRPSEAQGAPAPAPTRVAPPTPPQKSVAAADGEWVEIVPKYVDEGVAGKNSAPYVKVKDEAGDTYFVWDTALFGIVKASKGSVLWAITEESKKPGSPPRIVQVRTAPPADPESAADSEIPF